MRTCETCAAPCRTPHDCEACQYNIGITDSSSRIDGPCGQQNCWYGPTVCIYNDRYDYMPIDKD